MKLSHEAQRILANVRVRYPASGPFYAQIVEQVDRKLYVEVNAALEAMGGKWNRSAKAHLFQADPTDDLDRAVCAGEIKTNKDWGFFPTPSDVAERVIKCAEIGDGMSVLEPSAGAGALAVRAWLAAEDVDVTCVELDPKKVAELRRTPGLEKTHEADFLSLIPDERLGLFDRVVMNPPFGGSADVKHVLHALKFLKRNGRLVAVCSAGVSFRKGRLYDELRERIEDAGAIEQLPEGSFKESGTNCSTVMVTIDA